VTIEQLRLGKRPMLWTYRPAAWPAATAVTELEDALGKSNT
jgi:hypothetical protein